MGYRWSISDFGGASLDKNLPIPHCYVVEYKQLHNSSITNLINSVTAGVTSLSNLQKEAEKENNRIASGIDSINTLFNSLVSSLGQNDEESSGSLVGMVYNKI